MAIAIGRSVHWNIGNTKTLHFVLAKTVLQILMRHLVKDLEDKTLVFLIIAVSLTFALILWPFFSAIVWATLLAVVFAPLYRRLLKTMPQRCNFAALATVLVIIVIVILPLWLVIGSMLKEGSSLYERFQSGEFNLQQHLLQIRNALPEWAVALSNRFDLTSLTGIQDWLSTAIMRAGQYLAGQTLNIGQTTLDFIVNLFVMLYLLFFVLRDGDELAELIGRAIPLPAVHQSALFSKFTIAIRATIKGDVVIALVQGTLGGLIFWYLGIRAPVLWAAVMAVLSLLPVVGTGLVWGPVAIYLLMTGFVTEGITLLLYGVFVISLVDNVLRPVLVGKEIRMPSYVVLVSTLGGISIFGINGFVIGPLVAAMFIATWDLMLRGRHGDRKGRAAR